MQVAVVLQASRYAALATYLRLQHALVGKEHSFLEAESAALLEQGVPSEQSVSCTAVHAASTHNTPRCRCVCQHYLVMPNSNGGP
jgi:hypothetical protein